MKFERHDLGMALTIVCGTYVKIAIRRFMFQLSFPLAAVCPHLDAD
jgi:hypothetical protein